MFEVFLKLEIKTNLYYRMVENFIVFFSENVIISY